MKNGTSENLEQMVEYLLTIYDSALHIPLGALDINPLYQSIFQVVGSEINLVRRKSFTRPQVLAVSVELNNKHSIRIACLYLAKESIF